MAEDLDFKIKLENLEMVNFRGFKHVNIPFKNQWTVIIGENGAGKTTIIEALAGLLHVLISKIKSQSVQNIEGFDAERDLHVEDGEQAKEAINTLKATVNGHELEWFATLSMDGYAPEDVTDFSALDKLVAQINELFTTKVKINLPTIVYYPCFAAQEELLPERKLKADPFQAYDNALSGKPFEFGNFTEWFKGHEARAKNKEDSRRIIDATREAIYYFLNDSPDDWSDLRIDYEDYLSGELVIDKKGEKLKINQLSSGEKTLFLLVSDLTRRMALLNPKREKTFEGQGIVLIDEIDLHLHPRWEMAVVSKLKRTFPGIQFIITTHSPHVLQNVEREYLVILDNFQISKAELPYVEGRDTNSVLADAFLVNPGPRAEKGKIWKMVTNCYELIDDDKLEEAKGLLEKITEKWGENDRTVVELRTLLELATA